MRKIEILDKTNQRAFDSPPSFAQTDQKKYFTLPDDIAQWGFVA